ncbi:MULTISPECIES: hypothetical protein [Halomonadaceae]|uniref:Uncharacterized protein n=2 Tax=Vreelandella TaxID=3137766 RepID=A0A7Z0RXZ2_9GAMM|nr:MULTISPECIES: hypothetical protein [Halomonas]NYS77238.1 hypothetical protein [Halomonas glaciei]
MIDLTDSPQIERANELLADPTASVDALQAAQRGISDQMREVQAQPRIEPAMATSVAEHKRMTAELEQQGVFSGILSRLYGRLNDAIQRAVARDAIDGADQSRKDLAKALDTLETAQRKADAARAEVMAHTKNMQRDKSAAGLNGKGKVGATVEQVERIIAAGAFDARMGEQTSINGLRLKIQIDGGQPAVETRYVDHGAKDAGPVNVTQAERV